MPARRILLADADAFFVAVARMVDPDGAGKAPLLIVGGAPGSRGVVCSASYETRKFGVRSAMPISRALRLCPDAMCVPVPGAACRRKHREIRAVLERYAPVVQAASIDEWYLDLGGTEALYAGASLDDVAHRIRDAVIAETGLTVSIGGGSSKLVAKLAVERAKPKTGANGVHIVPDGDELAFMRQLELRDIPGIGPKTTIRLAERGLRSVEDVLALDDAALARLVGARDAEWLAARVRGEDEAEVAERDVAKSISRDETFHTDIHDDLVLEGELTELIGRAAAELRSDGLTARTITVRIRDLDFTTRQASRTVDEPLSSDRAIFAVARTLLRKLRKARRVPARLLGVNLSNFTTPPARQLALFESMAPPIETARDVQVARAMDAVRARFGRDAIAPGRKR
ncbi:MAG: DNA polymerase IV [Gemmatimonadaceae bacterium]|nr:DNA polymerase IV [Gemmatimonadaceae bacterium]NUR34220.1 DNA polymerase IV [Gemmatimonadaceae bacterium]